MDKNLCKVCSEKFDHSLKKPLVLIRCAHTFCAQCIGKFVENVCPICRCIIEDTSTNWSILETTPESSYDKAKADLEKQLKNNQVIKSKLNELKVKKLEENKFRADSITAQLQLHNRTLIKQYNREEIIYLKAIKENTLKFKQELELAYTIENEIELINLTENKYTEEELKALKNLILKQREGLYCNAKRIQKLRHGSNFLSCFIFDMKMVFHILIQNITTHAKMVFTNLLNNLKIDLTTESFISDLQTFFGIVSFFLYMLFLLSFGKPSK